MLIEVLKEPILINGVPSIKDIRLNVIDNQNQFRLKSTYIAEDKEDVHVDIVVYNWTIPKLDKLALSISIDGKEMLRNIKFELKISYDFFKRRWRAKGNFGNNVVNKDLESFMDIIMIIREYIQ